MAILDSRLEREQDYEGGKPAKKDLSNNGSNWSHVVFEHPAIFQTLAMEPEKKKLTT